MKYFYLFALFFLVVSCNEKVKRSKKSKEEYTNYKVVWLNIPYNDGHKEEIELYVSNKKDTIFNQFKIFSKDGEVNNYLSEFYDLKMYRTDSPIKFKGKITFHSKYSNILRKNKKARESLEFNYFQETKDSSFMTTLVSKNKSEIHFELTNIRGDQLIGFLIQRIDTDTIVNNEQQVRIRQIYKAVDNKIETNNTFIIPFRMNKDNKYKTKGIKFKPSY